MRLINVLIALVLAGCSFSAPRPSTSTIRVKVEGMADAKLLEKLGIPALRSGPSIDSMSCLAIAVSGPGIPDGTCVPILTSPLQPLSQNVLSLKVPSGPRRKVQVLGLYNGGATCPAGRSLPDHLAGTPVANWPEVFVLGEQTVDLFRDSAIVINQSYSETSSDPISLEACIPPASTVKFYVYTMNKTAGTIGVFNYNLSNLTLSPVTTFTDGHLSAPVEAFADPTGKFLYVADQGTQKVVTFRISPATGNLTYVTETTTIGILTHLVGTLGQPYLVSLNNAGGLHSFSYDSSGNLTVINAIGVAGSSNSAIVVHPGGRRLYVSDSVSGVVTEVDLTGGFLAGLGSHGAAGAGPLALSMTGGAGLYVATETMPGFLRILYYADAQGTLSGSDSATAQPFATSLAIDPSGTYAFVGAGGNINAFDISGGAIPVFQGGPFSSGGTVVNDMKFDPASTQMFTIDNSTGQLHSLAYDIPTGGLGGPLNYSSGAGATGITVALVVY